MHPININAALLARQGQSVVLIPFLIALALNGMTLDFSVHQTTQRLLAATSLGNLMAADRAVGRPWPDGVGLVLFGN